MGSTMSLQETDPVLAATKHWVFLLAKSWGAAPDPEVCLLGCQGRETASPLPLDSPVYPAHG